MNDVLDVDKAKAGVEAFTKVNDTLNTTKESDMFAGLAPIEKSVLAGNGSKIILQIRQALKDIYEIAKKEENILREYLEMEIAKDESDEEHAGGISNPGGGGGGKPEKPTEPEQPVDPVTPETPITKPELTDAIAALPPSALGGLMEELQALAKKENVTLDQLLADSKYADVLKALFAKWNIPQTLINAITGSETPGQFLKDLIDGKGNLVVKDEYLKTLKEKLEKIAKANNITLEQLLTDAKYSDLLKTSLEKIGKDNANLSSLINYVLKSSTIGTTLQSILNGTSTEVFTESEFNLIKEYLENIAKSNNITLDQLLTDPKYSEILKEALQNIKGNTSILGAMAGMSEADAQSYLADLIAGKYPEAFGINSQTLDGVFDYLNEVAKKNNITIEALLSDPKYSDILQSELKNYSNSINAIGQQLTGKTTEQMQAWLRDAYNGAAEGMDVNTIETVRNYIDSLAAQNNVTAEELIMNPENAAIIQGGLNNSAKVSVYLSNAATYQGENTQSYLNNMYTGKNYAAYGFNQENVESIKTSIQELASSQQTTVESLLTKPEYSEMIQTKLGEIDKSNALKQIYGDKSPETAQSVIKNLYDTKFESSEATGAETTPTGE